MTANSEKKTLVHCLLHWEKTTPDAIYFTQPYPDGRVVDYRWREVADQVRRMAAHLQSLNLPPRSSIALLGKNSAHWIMADLAIWMAGHVTVPLYPTLNGETTKYILDHCEAKLLFIGKLDGNVDGWNNIKPVLPAWLPKIGLPMSPNLGIPQWDELIAGTKPLKDPQLPEPDDLATIVYTSGSTGQPKGVMHCFRAMAGTFPPSGVADFPAPDDPMLSLLQRVWSVCNGETRVFHTLRALLKPSAKSRHGQLVEMLCDQLALKKLRIAASRSGEAQHATNFSFSQSA